MLSVLIVKAASVYLFSALFSLLNKDITAYFNITQTLNAFKTLTFWSLTKLKITNEESLQINRSSSLTFNLRISLSTVF